MGRTHIGTHPCLIKYGFQIGIIISWAYNVYTYPTKNIYMTIINVLAFPSQQWFENYID